MNFGLNCTPYTKKSTENVIMDLDVRCKTVKLLEIKSWENLQDIGLSNKFLAFTSEAQSKRKRLIYWTSSK